MNQKNVGFEVSLAVPDRNFLISYASELAGRPVTNIFEAISIGVCNPSGSAESAGYEITSKEVVAFGGEYCLRLQCRVFDEALLLSDAKDCYESCWGDSAWVPQSLNEALYEVVVASNANASPGDIGVELKGMRSVGVDVPFDNVTLGASVEVVEGRTRRPAP